MDFAICQFCFLISKNKSLYFFIGISGFGTTFGMSVGVTNFGIKKSIKKKLERKRF